MDIEIPAPVPLPQPGQYTEVPFPLWKVHDYQRDDKEPSQAEVFRVVNMPMPPDSRLVYHTFDIETVRDLREYALSVSGRQETPEWMRRFDPYTDAKYLAHSLSSRSLLKFDGRFESGNLHSAYALSETEYKLYLNPDTNSKGHIQWFYFSACPMKQMKTTFHIVNFMKEKCLFTKGMRPCFSYEPGGLSSPWAPLPDPCSYSPNGFSFCLKSGKTIDFHTLTFTFDFHEPKRPVYFSFAIPYTFTDLTTLLSKLESSDLTTKNIVLKKEKVCDSILGFPIELITITSAAPKAALPAGKRKLIVLTARVHPGETPGSLIMHEILSFLVSDSLEAKALRERYVFKLVPMLNPDGVVIGNSRTGVEGVDMNRRWRGEDSEGFPQLAGLKKMIKTWQNEGRLSIFCDLHGHAKQTNAFLYGCSHVTDEGFTSWTKVRLFPRVLAKVSQYFNYQLCKFKVQKGKMGTARVVVWQELGVSNSYTLETSFYSYSHSNSTLPFTKSDYFAFARDILISFLTYHQVELDLYKEIAYNGGWLKPNRMKDATGTPMQQTSPSFETEDRYQSGNTGESEVNSRTSKLSFHSNEGGDSQKLQKSASNRSIPGEIRSKKPSRLRRTKEKQQSWREFFNLEELHQRYAAKSGRIEEDESDSSGSDSAPSDDNLEESELLALKNGEMQREIAHKLNVPRSMSPKISELIQTEERKLSENAFLRTIEEGRGELEIVSREFVRSREKFQPGKPQDLLFTKIGLFRTVEPASTPSEPKMQRHLSSETTTIDSVPQQRRPVTRSALKLKPQRVSRISSHLITPPILLIESRTSREKKASWEANVEKPLKRLDGRKAERRYVDTARDLAFPYLQMSKSSKIPTVASMMQRSTERFASIEASHHNNTNRLL